MNHRHEGSKTGANSPSRRTLLKRVGAAGAAALTGTLASTLTSQRTAAAPSAIVSWAAGGERFEFAQKGVLPLFNQKFSDIAIKLFAEPVADFFPKTAVAMGSKSDRYDVIYDDYNFVPQFISQGALETLDPYLDRDPKFKADLLSDVPEAVMDLYRDKPLAQGGKLYGIPPDGNCQMQYYRADVFEKSGLKPAETWEDVIAIAKELSKGGVKVTGSTLKRGLFAGGVFISIMRSYGGDWFDKMEAGGWKVQLESDAGHQAFDILQRLTPFLEPTAINASDDEANNAMLNGTWTFAPLQWGGSTMNDPKFTKFSNDWMVTVAPKGTGGKARHAPHMGGLGLVMPSYGHNKEAAWEWIKFCCSGDNQDPAIGKAWVESTGQPARLSLLKKYTSVRPYFSGLMESLPLAVRYPPIPESNALYELVGTEVAAVIIGQTNPGDALKNMQSQATKLMEKGGYYKG
jgi:multiple sugar transport system substrate-binding protein